MTSFTESELARMIDRFGRRRRRIDIVTELAHEGEPDGIGTPLLLAMGARESFLTNIVGDQGHGRGWLQIDDRFHAAFLRSHRGCPSGTYVPTKPSALPRGLVPTLTAATIHIIGEMRNAMALGREHGVPAGQVLRFAVAAHNAGPTGALRGFQQGDVDMFSTNHYSQDVLAMKAMVVRILEREAITV